MNGDTTFITSGFEGVISPMVRVTHEVLDGWNLIVLAAVLLLVVINKQLYPRQFRQLLSVPGGVAHTNQLLREWTPTRSFIGFSFLISYILVIALFVQKTCVIFSRDVLAYNSFNIFSIVCACVAGWIIVRHLILALMGWLFRQKELVTRQITVELSSSTLCFFVITPIMLLVLYMPYTIFVWIGIGILFATALMKLFLEFIETRVFSKMPSLYIFLYFCTLEIVPLTLLLVAGLRYFTHNTVI
ncbi:MAG: DUF4271 domain-containing protein [Bacteroidales bacterium]|nr:DUF4271 domain-containing protein [Bacteroidales bacterium]